MGRIQLLPQALADRIAAGEVVERPASVVRELLDNALDAGSRRVSVDLEAGGIDLVAVADDGEGMDPDDAVLAFERHATSKIRTGDDLDAVRTLGFRGEALAAIAAVSRVELISRQAAAAEGTRVLVDRGRLAHAGPASRAPGTTVSVRELFAGIPARRKFLKGPGVELEHCLAVAGRSALAHWEVGFQVRVEGQERLAAPPTPGPAERIAQVLGPRWSGALVPAERQRGASAARVWAGRTDVHRPSRDGIHLFVNRRAVRDALLMRAVLDAYRAFLPAGRFPVVVLHLDLPPTDVDVNVHPAKSEVRFLRPQDIRALVQGALGEALGERAAIPHFVADGGRARQAAALWGDGSHADPGAVAEPFATQNVADETGRCAALPGHPARVRALAQHRECFIVAEDEQGLLVVDQHVAHERLLYESLLRQAESGPLARQALLFPRPVEVGPAAAELAAAAADTLARAGFGVEAFGPSQLLVREVPATLGREAGAETVVDILEQLKVGDAPGAASLFHRLIATVACHSAVRKGMSLSIEKMDYILRGLDSCAAPSHCPHGRVISLRVDLQALDRGFGRS